MNEEHSPDTKEKYYGFKKYEELLADGEIKPGDKIVLDVPDNSDYFYKHQRIKEFIVKEDGDLTARPISPNSTNPKKILKGIDWHILKAKSE